MHYKYKKTYHLPFSQGLQNDDRRLEDEHCFDGKTLAVTIKMDGENTSMYRDGLHARSLSSAHHPSRSVVKALHAQIRNDIPEGWRICGENMYAKHSIHYTDLESFFYVFSIWNEKNECLSLEETQKFCTALNLTHVKIVSIITDFECPVRSMFPSNLYYLYDRKEGDWKFLEKAYNYVVGLGQEGIVVRNVESYHYDDFQHNIAKAVRKDHIQTTTHWSKEWVPNQLRNEE